jgi:sulfate adenylyltransferase subunit 1 (EFTu-like GTPase family)
MPKSLGQVRLEERPSFILIDEATGVTVGAGMINSGS